MKRGCGDISEDEILRRIGHGDNSVKKMLYDLHIRYLTAVCARYVIDENDINDVLQNGFLKILSSLSSFEYRGKGSLKAWMTRIIVNEALKCLRDNERLRFESIDESFNDIADTGADPDIDELSPDMIHGIIRELPVGYRTVFNLYVFENKSHKEIAGILGISENTSASQFHRAKKLLKTKIKDYNSFKDKVCVIK